MRSCASLASLVVQSCSEAAPAATETARGKELDERTSERVPVQSAASSRSLPHSWSHFLLFTQRVSLSGREGACVSETGRQAKRDRKRGREGKEEARGCAGGRFRHIRMMKMKRKSFHFPTPFSISACIPSSRFSNSNSGNSRTPQSGAEGGHQDLRSAGSLDRRDCHSSDTGKTGTRAAVTRTTPLSF